MLLMRVLIDSTALDMTPTILIMAPVLMPVLKQAGIDPVYFGVRSRLQPTIHCPIDL